MLRSLWLARSFFKSGFIVRTIGAHFSLTRSHRRRQIGVQPISSNVAGALIEIDEKR